MENWAVLSVATGALGVNSLWGQAGVGTEGAKENGHSIPSPTKGHMQARADRES